MRHLHIARTAATLTLTLLLGCERIPELAPPAQPSMLASPRPAPAAPSATPMPRPPLPPDCPQPIDATQHAPPRPKPTLTVTGAEAYWPLASPQELPTQNTSTTRHQMAFNPRAEAYLALWEQTDVDSAAQTGSQHLYAQRIADDGSAIGTPIRVVPETAYQTSPSLALNSQSGEAMVAWGSSNGADTGVFVRLLNGFGAPVGAPIRVGEAKGYDPRVVYNARSREYLVLWSDTRSSVTHCPLPPHSLYAQRIGMDGRLLGKNFPIVPTYTGHWSYSVVHNAIDDQYMVVWATSSAPLIAMQRLDATGARLGEVITVETESWPGRPLRPLVAHHGERNEFLVAWSDFRHGDEDVYAQRFDRAGTAIGQAFPIAVSPDEEWPERLIHDPSSGAYLAVWRRGFQIPTGGGESFGSSSLEARFVSAEGRLFGEKVALDADGIGLTVAPHPEGKAHLILSGGAQLQTQRVRLAPPGIEPMPLESVQAPATGVVGQPVTLGMVGINPDSCWTGHEGIAMVDDEKREVRLAATQKRVAQVCHAAMGHSEVSATFVPRRAGTYTILATTFPRSSDGEKDLVLTMDVSR